jgi:hypothetical protein
MDGEFIPFCGDVCTAGLGSVVTIVAAAALGFLGGSSETPSVVVVAAGQEIEERQVQPGASPQWSWLQSTLVPPSHCCCSGGEAR